MTGFIEPNITRIHHEYSRTWIDLGPYEPADSEQLSFELPILSGLSDIADRLKAIAALFYPQWTFDGWHMDYETLSTEPDPF
jgi:hypothetical protein